MRNRSDTGPERRDRGASAVEFALVAPLLFALLFGTVDYGLYVADMVGVQQGLDDAARSATLAPSDATGPQWGSASCSVQQEGTATPLAGLACAVLGGVEPVAGKLYVRAELVDSTGAPTQTWTTGHRLRLCAVTQHAAVLPFVPLPAGGRTRTRVEMPIQAVPAAVVMTPVQSLLPEGGDDWSWC